MELKIMSWDLVEEAKKIISINSVTYESNRPLIDHLLGLLKPLDLEIELQEGVLSGKPQFNLIGKKGPREGDTLLFNSHSDTVSPGDYSLWDKTGGNPFRATIIDEKIYGLGAADAKLDVLCKIKAIESFKERSFKNPFVLVATYGEESGLEGAKKLIQENKVKPRYAVVGEPSNLSIVYAHKGHLVLEFNLKDLQAKKIASSSSIFRVDCFGKAAHSSTPHLGINAIQKGADFLKKHHEKLELINFNGGELINVIPDRASFCFLASEKLIPEESEGRLATEKTKNSQYVFTANFLMVFDELQGLFRKLANEFKKHAQQEFDPSTSLLNLGVISTHENTIRMIVGIRTLPLQDSKELVERIKTQFSQIVSRFSTLKGSCQVLRESPPMRTEPTSTLVTAAGNILREMGLQETLVTKAGATEAAIYRHLGAEAIVWGPGVAVGNIHRPNEYNYLHHLHHAVRFYEKLIELFCVKGVR